MRQSPRAVHLARPGLRKSLPLGSHIGIQLAHGDSCHASSGSKTCKEGQNERRQEEVVGKGTCQDQPVLDLRDHGTVDRLDFLPHWCCGIWIHGWVCTHTCTPTPKHTDTLTLSHTRSLLTSFENRASGSHLGMYPKCGLGAARPWPVHHRAQRDSSRVE